MRQATTIRARANVLLGCGLLSCIVPLVAGCSDPDSGVTGPLYPVKGKVLLADGKPLTSGQVVFVGTKEPVTLEGPIGADGGFTLDSGSLGKGAPAGDYKVRVEVDLSKQPQSKGKPARNSGPLPFPANYTDEDKSGLLATVKAGDNDLPPFTLAK